MSDCEEDANNEGRYASQKRVRPSDMNTDVSPQEILKKVKTAINISEDQNTPDQEEKNSGGISAKTMNVKDFCTVLSGFGSTPDLSLVLFSFDSDGMKLYAKPASSPVVIQSFWNKSMFQGYKCEEKVMIWVQKSRLEEIRKRIVKDVECLHISSMPSSDSNGGLIFSGSMAYKSGGSANFSINAFQYESTEEVYKMDLEYNWHVVTSSEKFKTDVEFIVDGSECVSMRLENKELALRGVTDMGLIGEEIKHETDSSDLTVFFTSMFTKKYLKIVTSTQALHKTVNIAFIEDDSSVVKPVLFSYHLDQSSVQSHFSVYIVPLVI
jgi:hypothetical protein